FDSHAEIKHQLPDDWQLLKIFFTEDGDVRQNDVKKLGHDGGDPAKMARAGCATQRQAKLLDVDVGLPARRIDLLDGGMKQDVDIFVCQQFEVAHEVARVGGKIFAGAELRRIDKDRHHHAIAALSRCPHQTEMSFVQEPH